MIAVSSSPHPHFVELDVDRRQVFCDWSLVRPSAVVMINDQQGDAPKDGRCNTAKDAVAFGAAWCGCSAHDRASNRAFAS
jgi:hypothetical protein